MRWTQVAAVDPCFDQRKLNTDDTCASTWSNCEQVFRQNSTPRCVRFVLEHRPSVLFMAWLTVWRTARSIVCANLSLTRNQAGTGMVVLEGIPGLSRKHCLVLSLKRHWSPPNLISICDVISIKVPSPSSQKKALAMCRCHLGRNLTLAKLATNCDQGAKVVKGCEHHGQDVSTNGTYLNGKRLPRPPFKNPADWAHLRVRRVVCCLQMWLAGLGFFLKQTFWHPLTFVGRQSATFPWGWTALQAPTSASFRWISLDFVASLGTWGYELMTRRSWVTLGPYRHLVSSGTVYSG